MDAEIVFTGLCSILNPDGKNRTMGEPAVILVQTDDTHHSHTPFLAFNPDEVEVTGASGLKPVNMAEPFLYMPISGVELVIEGNPPDTPVVHDSYKQLVAHKDEYWPDVKDNWDRAFVPEKGNRPAKSAVKAWMRLGKGLISAAKVSEVPWRFTNADGTVTKEDKFAEEVIYSGFPHSGDEVVIKLLDLESGDETGTTLRFRLKQGASKMTLTIGNAVDSDMANAVRREPTKRAKNVGANHFKYLNRVSGGDGPKVDEINPPPDLSSTSGGSGGACGPGSGNGKP